MNGKVTKCLLGVLMFGVGTSAYAGDETDEKVSLEVGADIVSSYIWRGIDCAGFSAQPGATVTFNRPGISFGVWASASLFDMSEFANMNEFDLSLSYSPSDAFSVGLTDYHFCNGKYWADWTFNGNSAHNLELNLSYDFGGMAVAWNTCLTGPDHRSTGDRAYSTYFELSKPFSVSGVDCTATVGACPWGYYFGAEYGSGFSVANVSLKAEKEFKGVPIFGEIVFNPRTEKTFFVVGVSF